MTGGSVIALAATGTAIGICLVTGDQVVEACTVAATGKRSTLLADQAGVAATAIAAVTTAQSLVGDAVRDGLAVPVWVFLAAGLPDLATQRQRAAARTERVAAARVLTVLTTGAVLAALTAAGITPVLIDPAAVTTVPDDDGPPALSGRVPRVWSTRAPGRHAGRADRAPQRLAWAVALAAPDTRDAPAVALAKVPVTKVAVVVRPDITDREWINKIRANLAATVPTTATHREVLEAAATALTASPAPHTLAAITAVEVATDCVLSGGVARPLWGLRATLLSQFTKTNNKERI